MSRLARPRVAPANSPPERRSSLKPEQITAVEIGPTEDGTQLRIRWQDGHVSEYTPRYLRLSCPCAGCVEEMSGRPLLDPAYVPADVYPLAIRYVGRYALGFDWSDRHDTGIYPFKYLRELCRCLPCLDPDAPE